MTSLTEAYQGNTREVTSLRRLYAGTSLVLLGAMLSVLAVLVPTTDLFAGYVAGATAWEMPDHYATVRVAGALAGVGVPAALVGVFIVLPASRRVRAAGAISASLCLLGVVLFWEAYPHHWRGYGADLTLEVSAIYLFGLFIAIWCLFAAVVNFKTRNDPGGMLEMNVTRHNQTVVEVDDSSNAGSLGGVGLLGETPDGDVETQTNAGGDGRSSSSTRAGQSRSQRRSNSARRTGAATSDGGSRGAEISSPLEADAGDGSDAEIVDSPTEPPTPTDRYCGNCSHFEYVRSSGMVPYCARHDETMENMDACEEWTPNRR
ncbi:hypothetical protein CV102_08085 [Natronococcus pandeyae]|uniref:Uncharacterized protein n=1 Tax=Natronococcus pandeyae TaxID=2055836 RepID=A0A8J8TSM9_9EURY|nr:hypothetical protein [Natronococcus pandeyae]TYL39235.1 hypothetical protein CV102_08085 [Natronococcus pandeyae]